MKAKISIVSEELFKISLIIYLLLLLAETIKEGFVSYFFNPNYLLFVVLMSGVAMALTTDALTKHLHAKKEEKPKKLTSWNWEYMFSMSVLGGVLVYYKTQDLGNLSLIISLITAIIIFLLSYLILTDTEEE